MSDNVVDNNNTEVHSNITAARNSNGPPQPTDLGTEEPQRPLMQSFPSRLFSGKKGHFAVPGLEAFPGWSTQFKQMLHTASHAECFRDPDTVIKLSVSLVSTTGSMQWKTERD